MSVRTVVVWTLTFSVLVAGCGGSRAQDAAQRETLREGVSQIARTPNAEVLARSLRSTIRTLRRERGSTTAARRGRALALAGFGATLHGVETQLAMRVHDSGKLEAAVRDARRSDRYLNRGARLLRAAGRELGVDVGKVNGR